MDKKYYEGEEKIIDNREPVNTLTPVQESPSEIIHNKLLGLRDSLDKVSIEITGKLSPVMNDYPVQPNDEIRGNSGLPPLFEQYAELIDHIELVARDISIKLDNVDI